MKSTYFFLLVRELGSCQFVWLAEVKRLGQFHAVGIPEALVANALLCLGAHVHTLLNLLLFVALFLEGLRDVLPLHLASHTHRVGLPATLDDDHHDKLLKRGFLRYLFWFRWWYWLNAGGVSKTELRFFFLRLESVRAPIWRRIIIVEQEVWGKTEDTI